MQNYVLLGICWLVYFSLHSLLAADRPKELAKQKLGLGPIAYRRIYVLIAVFGLLGILLYSSTFNEDFLTPRRTGLRFGALVLAAGGTMVIREALRQYNPWQFLGLTRENPEGKLYTGGILQYIRHPIYSGSILIIAGFVMFSPKISSMVTAGCMFIYLFIGVRLEERRLIRKFGDKYLEYKKMVGGVLPKLFCR